MGAFGIGSAGQLELLTFPELTNLPVVPRLGPQPSFPADMAAQPCAIPLKNVLRTDPHDRIKIAPGRDKGTIREVKPPAPSCDEKK